HTELGDGLLGGGPIIQKNSRRSGLDRLLVTRREREQRVLDAIAELPEHDVRDVERILRDEEHAHTLRADEAYDLLDLVKQHLRRVAEQQMRLIEEEHEPW